MTAPDRIRTRRYWAAAMFGFLTISVAGNVAHAALIAPPDLRWAGAAWATVPPLILVTVTEGLMRSAAVARTGRRRWAYVVGVFAAVALAAGAFIVSFIALRDLTATLLAAPPVVAITMPLIIDAGIAVAGVMALAHTEPATPAVSPVPNPHTDPQPAPAPTAEPVPVSTATATVAGALTRADAVDVPGPVGVDAVPAAGVDADTLRVATALVERGVVRADADAVAAAVSGLMAGESRRAVAVATGLHRDTVARIAAGIETAAVA
ncbi:MAG: hypothetical protein WBO08_18660 [Mycobacterium sp.]